MATRQQRLKGVKWSDYSNKQSGSRRGPTGSSGPAQEGQPGPQQGPVQNRPHPLIGAVGPHSSAYAATGHPGGPTSMSRYYNPNNVNGNQFNTPAVKEQLQSAVHAHTRSQYFRAAGFGAAMRYTLGMEQVPSHLQDYMNARLKPRNSTGIHPGPIYSHGTPRGMHDVLGTPSQHTEVSDL